MRWRLAQIPLGELTTLPRPPNRKRQRAFGARRSLFRVHFYNLNSPFGPLPYGIPGSATGLMCCCIMSPHGFSCPVLSLIISVSFVLGHTMASFLLGFCYPKCHGDLGRSPN